MTPPEPTTRDIERAVAHQRANLAAHVEANGYLLAAELIRRGGVALVLVPSELPLELGNLPTAPPRVAADALRDGHAVIVVANGART